MAFRDINMAFLQNEGALKRTAKGASAAGGVSCANDDISYITKKDAYGRPETLTSTSCSFDFPVSLALADNRQRHKQDIY